MAVLRLHSFTSLGDKIYVLDWPSMKYMQLILLIIVKFRAEWNKFLLIMEKQAIIVDKEASGIALFGRESLSCVVIRRRTSSLCDKHVTDLVLLVRLSHGIRRRFIILLTTDKSLLNRLKSRIYAVSVCNSWALLFREKFGRNFFYTSQNWHDIRTDGDDVAETNETC